MRTKTSILTAALIAAGVASSMAQSNVYSLNVVGYINLTIKPGFNLISLPLQSSDVTSSINSVLTNTTPVVPFGSYVSTWDPSHGNFAQAVYAGGDGVWYDGGFNGPVTNGLPPGKGFFFFAPKVSDGGVASLNVTVTGTVLTGPSTNTVTPGFNFYGQAVPIVGDITTNGLPVVDFSYLSFWDTTNQAYTPAVYGLGTNDGGYDGSGNITGAPSQYPVFADGGFSQRVLVAPLLGQGFTYTFTGTTNTPWTQNFIVQ